MNNNFNTLKKKFINEIILPGTHNSGTYKINLNKKLERDYEIIRLLGKFFNPLKKHIQKFTLNQELTIYEQCKIGIRMLDLRIFYDKKNNLFYNSHSFITVSLEDIINDLIKFIKENNNEYIIVFYKQDYPYKNQKYDYAVLDEYINSKKYCILGYKNLYTLTYEQLLTTEHRIIWVEVNKYNVKQIWPNTFNKKKLIDKINNTNNSNGILYERKILKKYVYEDDHKNITKNFGNQIIKESTSIRGKYVYEDDHKNITKNFGNQIIKESTSIEKKYHKNYIGWVNYQMKENSCEENNMLPITHPMECSIAGQRIGERINTSGYNDKNFSPGCYTDKFDLWHGTGKENKKNNYYTNFYNICRPKEIDKDYDRFIKLKLLNNIDSISFYGISCCLTPQILNVAFEIMINIIAFTIPLVFIIYNVISYNKYNKQTLKFNKFKINNKSVYSLIISSVVIFVILLFIKMSKITNLKEQTKEFHKSFLKIKLNKNLGFYLFDYPTKELTTKIIDINLK